MRRLTLAIAIVAAALGPPQISRGETVLRFIPQADLRVLDPTGPAPTSPAITVTWFSTLYSASTVES